MSLRNDLTAGSMPAAFKISQTVEAAIWWPSLANSPWIRRCPQYGFSRASRSTSDLIDARVGGRPVRRLAV